MECLLKDKVLISKRGEEATLTLPIITDIHSFIHSFLLIHSLLSVPHCRLEPMGDAGLTVEWFHNNKPLTTGHRFKTYSGFG